ncbi:hypothetical protein LZ32DRAFT_370275 [Colletotrichum eremochloae]|nr:hypothetical protein LZ32DRAFT_370275 [Colletotrichum eremochloae]
MNWVTAQGTWVGSFGRSICLGLTWDPPGLFSLLFFFFFFLSIFAFHQVTHAVCSRHPRTGTYIDRYLGWELPTGRCGCGCGYGFDHMGDRNPNKVD